MFNFNDCQPYTTALLEPIQIVNLNNFFFYLSIAILITIYSQVHTQIGSQNYVQNCKLHLNLISLSGYNRNDRRVHLYRQTWLNNFAFILIKNICQATRLLHAFALCQYVLFLLYAMVEWYRNRNVLVKQLMVNRDLTQKETLPLVSQIFYTLAGLNQ